MGAKMRFQHLLFLCLLAWSFQGSFGYPLYDMTSTLYKRTIYIESQDYYGYWIGPTDSYNGHIFELSEKEVFDYRNPCRIEVIDCKNGWACLRTRYQESYRDIDHQRDNGTNSTRGSSSYFLEADYYDVDFSVETASPQYKDDWFKWKIKCPSPNLEYPCYIENKYYEGAQLYAHYDNTLDTEYRKDGDGDIDDWFRWRIMSPIFHEVSPGGVEIGSTCNCLSSDAEYTFTLSEGIGIDSRFSFSTHFDATISGEVRAGVASASSSVSAGWETELSTATTWNRQKEDKITVTVPVGKQVRLNQLQGQYGHGEYQPYTIGASNYKLTEIECCD